MRYALLICEDPSLFPRPGEPEYPAMMAEYERLTAELDESGERVGGLRLEGPDTATSVRVRNDDVVLTDGPFAETREHLGGFYIVDVASRERALELAARIPGARFGVVEVRPLYPGY